MSSLIKLKSNVSVLEKIKNNPISRVYRNIKSLYNILKYIDIYETKDHVIIDIKNNIFIESQNIILKSKSDIILQSNVDNDKCIHLNPISKKDLCCNKITENTL